VVGPPLLPAPQSGGFAVAATTEIQQPTRRNRKGKGKKKLHIFNAYFSYKLIYLTFFPIHIKYYLILSIKTFIQNFIY